MRYDFIGWVLRWGFALLLFTLTVLFLYLAGAAQNFLESSLSSLYRIVRLLGWLGFLGSWLLILPLARKHRGRTLVAVGLGIGFTLIFGFVLVWGSWVYPETGSLPW